MKFFIKFLKITGICSSIFLVILFIIPFLIPKAINEELTKIINKQIKGEIKFENTKLSFFSHFPSLTLSLNQFLLKGSAPFQKDTLIYAKEMAMGINVISLLGSELKVDKFFLDDAEINILTDKNGLANYNVYESNTKEKSTKDSTETSLKIEGIYIKNSNLIYNDQSLPMLINIKGLNYSGTGDLSKAIFDLKSKLKTERTDIYYNGTPYLLNKKLNAKLVTKINTGSLDLLFDENNLKINEMPIRFVGRFSFLKNGYDMDFKTQAKETDLHNIFTALPPEIHDRLEKTNIKGYAEINASLIGKYIALSKTMPDLNFEMKIREGEITNPKAPESIKNLFLNFKTSLPGLNPDSIFLNIDSLYFNVGKDYFLTITKVKGYKEPEIFTKTRSNIDLEKWAKVLNIDSVDIKGRLITSIDAKGKYTKKIIKSGLRRIDTVTATIPAFDAKINLSNGYFKMAKLPSAIELINFKFNGQNSDGNYANTKLQISDINIKALSNFINGYIKLQSINGLTIDLGIKTALNFAEIKKFYPLKGINLKGKLALELNSKGIYNTTTKSFPVTKALIQLDDGYIKTKYFNEALEKIDIDAVITNSDGTLKSTLIDVKPISFIMAGEPFYMKANMSNLDNINYEIKTKGLIDVGKFYQMFAVPGYQVNGQIYTMLSLKGLQSDALAGRYYKMKNYGKMEITDLNILTDIYPKPFIIKNGKFTFSPSAMKFDEFKANYGHSDFTLNGELNNYMGFVFSKNENLKGNFILHSKKVNADEFMAFADNSTERNNKIETKNSLSGVIIIPKNLNIGFDALIDQVDYNGISLNNAKGNMYIDNGKLSLSKTGFELVGAQVEMDANYQSTSPKSANFDFKLNAKEFDIARAYKEIKLFREMATSASKVKGVVGLDYQLSGRLNEKMFPVFPSIKGEGQLVLHNVKLAGFKMINAVSKTTQRDSVTNPNLKDVVIKSTIKNNIINIERTKMKIAGFRPRFEGQVSFDGKLNLKGRLGLPPFGLFGIPLSITGTQEKPIVRLKRNKEGKLEETEDTP